MYNQIFHVVDSILRITILPQGLQPRHVPPIQAVPIQSFKHLWLMIGHQYRLSTSQIQQLKHFASRLFAHNQSTKELFSIVYQFQFQHQQMTFDPSVIFQHEQLLLQHLDTLSSIQNECVSIVHVQIPALIQKIQQAQTPSVSATNRTLVEEPEDAIAWLRILLDTYEKYGGLFPANSLEIFQFFKGCWRCLKDEDTIHISNITDTILGGVSLEHIASNFTNWIQMNQDIKNKEPRLEHIH